MTLAFFKQSEYAPFSKDLLMQSANTENVKLHSFKTFVGISPPSDLLLLRSLITCFTSFPERSWNENSLTILKFCLIVLMLGWLTSLIKILSVSSSLVCDGGTLENLSVHMCRSNDSTIDPKYSTRNSFSSFETEVEAERCLFVISEPMLRAVAYQNLGWKSI